jgi:hypothetical protein
MSVMNFVIKWSDSWLEGGSPSIGAVVEENLALLLLRVAALRIDKVVGLMSFTIHSLMFVLRALVELLRNHSTFLGGFHGVDVFWFNLRKVELLWSKNGARSSNSNPANESFSWNLEMFHGPDTN